MGDTDTDRHTVMLKKLRPVKYRSDVLRTYYTQPFLYCIYTVRDLLLPTPSSPRKESTKIKIVEIDKFRRPVI